MRTEFEAQHKYTYGSWNEMNRYSRNKLSTYFHSTDEQLSILDGDFKLMKTECLSLFYIKMLVKFTSSIFFFISVIYPFLSCHRRFALNKIPWWECWMLYIDLGREMIAADKLLFAGASSYSMKTMIGPGCLICLWLSASLILTQIFISKLKSW